MLQQGTPVSVGFLHIFRWGFSQRVSLQHSPSTHWGGREPGGQKTCVASVEGIACPQGVDEEEGWCETKKWGWSWCAEELRGRIGRDQAWARDGLVLWPGACCGFVCRVHLLRAWQNWAPSGTCTARCWLCPRSSRGVGASKGFVFALWASLPVEKFLLVHLTPQKLPQEAVAANIHAVNWTSLQWHQPGAFI